MTSITLSATNAPRRPAAGVAMPDSKLAPAITELVPDTASPLLFNHSPRVIRRSAVTEVRGGLKFDMGLTPQYSGADERFEVDGENAARWSTVAGERGGAHVERGIRGTAPTFSTEQGNRDMETTLSLLPQAVADV